MIMKNQNQEEEKENEADTSLNANKRKKIDRKLSKQNSQPVPRKPEKIYKN